MIGGLLERNPRLANWLWGFTPPERGTIILVHRRVYIVPTRLGWLFAATLLILLIGSINYALSLGLRAHLPARRRRPRRHGAHGAQPRAHRGERRTRRAGVRRRIGAVPPLPRRPRPDSTVPRSSRATSARARNSWSTSPPAALAEVVLAVPARSRGWLPLGRVMLETRFPLGLFRAWSYVEPDARCLVYPQPERSPLPPPLAEAAAGALRSPRLRAATTSPACATYQLSDSPRHVAWKAVARSDELLTKQFTGEAAAELWLDWRLLPATAGAGAAPVAPRRLGARRRARWRALRRCAFRASRSRPGAAMPTRGACLQALALYELR